MTTPESWVVVGADVASIRFGQQKSITYSKISRVGKAFLTLENGEKFHVLGLDRQEGPNIGGSFYKLFPANSERVQQISEDMEIKKIMKSAAKNAEKFVKDPTVPGAEETILALLPFTRWDIFDTATGKPLTHYGQKIEK